MTPRLRVADPSDMVLVGGGGITLGGLLVGAIRLLGSRNINALDDTLKSLRDAVKELHEEVRHLRETDLMQGKDIGALQQELKDLKERVDGQGEAWRKQFDAMARRAKR